MKAKVGFVLGLAATAWLLAGCPSQNKDNGNGAPLVDELAAKARPAIPDVPMPVDFRYIDDRSCASASAGAPRFIAHVYRGSADKFAVARFYRKQMPLSGWQIKTETDALAIKVMEFTKEGETCRITLQDGGVWDKTEIQVLVFTSAKGDYSGPRKVQ